MQGPTEEWTDAGGVEVNQSAKDAGCRVGKATAAKNAAEMYLAGKGQPTDGSVPPYLSVEHYWPPNKGSSARKGCDS